MGQKLSRDIEEEVPVKSQKIEVHRFTKDPTRAWREDLAADVRVTTVPRIRFDATRRSNTLRFVCISDTHSCVENNRDFIQKLPSGDVLLHAGDFTRSGRVNEFLNFDRFLGELRYPVKVVIPGNHEVLLDPQSINRKADASASPDDLRGMPKKNDISTTKRVLSHGILLIDSMVEICGIKIYGTPWVPLYNFPAFSHARGKKLLKMYNQIPADIDVLLCHGPPLGFGDTYGGGKKAGCVELLNSIRHRIRPKYVVFGHIHGRNGIETDGFTRYINATICDRNYKPTSAPIIFDYPIPAPYTRADFTNLYART